MIASFQPTSEQLKEIIDDEMKTIQGAKEIQEQVDGKSEDLDPNNTSSALNTYLDPNKNAIEHGCLDEAGRLLNAHPIHKSTDDSASGQKYSIPGRPSPKFLAHQIRDIWSIVRRWL